MLGNGMHHNDWPLQLCVIVGLLLFPVVISQIPLGSKLSVAENKYWVSSNGDFVIGFLNRSDQPNLFSIGIHFNSDSIPATERKVVWVAGADIMVGYNSYFQLTQSGELVLFDSSKGFIVWGSKTSHLSVASAVLHDNGNLVLLNGHKVIVWQSFDTPSDTLLPGQNFTLSQTLRAASRNSISSYYTFRVNASGHLQLKWESDVIYWTSGTSSYSNISAVVTSEGGLQLLDNKSIPIWSAYGEDHNDSVDYRFLRLDVDGNLRLYSWVEALRSWKSVWRAVENQCDVFATCNLCGVCTFNASGFPVCKCLFTTTTASSSSKCLVPYQPKCNLSSTLMSYEHTFLYGIYPPIHSVITSSLQQCKSLCLSDPLCTAVTYANDGTAQCLMKKTVYVTGSLYPSIRSISFVKSCLDPVAVMPKFPVSPPSGSPQKKPTWVLSRSQIGVALGMFAAFILFQIGVCFFILKRGKKSTAAYYLSSNPYKGLIILSYTEIEEATGKFKHQMGPEAFKGILTNKREVAVRNIKAAIEERKFRSEVLKIGSICHKNLLKLEGYCCESSHRFLVYEFPENGSLDKYIEDSHLRKNLNWRKRIDMCLSVARVISYLHSGCREFFNHGNLKCQNVVLDENLDPMVSEFGLGRLQNNASCDASTAARDVEDFGKMVITLVCGREGVCEWAYDEWNVGQSQKLVDEVIQCGVCLEELECILRIAFWCLQVDERMRPSMGEVIKVLEGTLPVDPPPPPFVRQTPSEEESLELELE